MMQQFLLRSSESDVERYLKLFTFIPVHDIAALMKEHNTDPGKRKAQHLLAREVLELVHGREEAERSRAEHEVMRNPTLTSLSSQRKDGNQSAETEQLTTLPRSLFLQAPLSHVLWHAGLASTKSEGKRLIAKGGVYVASATMGKGDDLNFVKVTDVSWKCNAEILSHGRLILRLGKWKVRVIDVVEDDVFEAEGRDVPGWEELLERRKDS